jgi:hypothetical protein
VKKVPGLSLEIMRIMASRLRRANAAPHAATAKRPAKAAARPKPRAKTTKKTKKK